MRRATICFVFLAFTVQAVTAQGVPPLSGPQAPPASGVPQAQLGIANRNLLICRPRYKKRNSQAHLAIPNRKRSRSLRPSPRRNPDRDRKPRGVGAAGRPFCRSGRAARPLAAEQLCWAETRSRVLPTRPRR